MKDGKNLKDVVNIEQESKKDRVSEISPNMIISEAKDSFESSYSVSSKSS